MCDNLLKDITACKEVVWVNPKKKSFSEVKDNLPFSYNDIVDAEKRWQRFAPLLKKLFPETENGIIESPLYKADKLKTKLEEYYSNSIDGELFLKCDNYLKVAGSVKARGGIYEVLKHAESLAIEAGLLSENDDYSVLAEDRFRKFFSEYKLAVGSTGNLGLSIGIMGSALGFKVFVHMSKDAKEWKKDILRRHGVTVIEHEADYTKAVEEGRKQAEADERMYFVDDENSKDLFLGYSVVGFRLKQQLKDMNLLKDGLRINVYLPCGVGGAPGGITFGLKHAFGDNVSCIFVEPTHAPCMLLGLLTGKYEEADVSEYGIKLETEADGLAVAKPSKLVSRFIEYLIDGIYTISDDELFKLVYMLYDSESIKAEPSAVASLKGPIVWENGSEDILHICWLTGGMLIPDDIFSNIIKRGKLLL